MALLIGVKLVGVTSNGGKRWLNLHLINLQPSELFKLFTVLFLAWLVQAPPRRAQHWKQLAIWTLPVWLGCGLIVLEPDIGTASVVLIIALAVLGVRWLIANVAGARRGIDGRRGGRVLIT